MKKIKGKQIFSTGFVKRWQLVIMVDIIMKKCFNINLQRITEVLRMKNELFNLSLVIKNYDEFTSLPLLKIQQKRIRKILKIFWGLGRKGLKVLFI